MIQRSDPKPRSAPKITVKKMEIFFSVVGIKLLVIEIELKASIQSRAGRLHRYFQYFCSTTRYAVDEQQSDQTLHSLAFQSNSYNSIVSNRFFPTISDENSSAYASYYVRLLQASRPFSRVPCANHRDCFPTHVLCGVTSRIRFFEALDLSGHIGVDFWHVRTRSATKIPQLLHTREHNHQFL